MFNVLGSINDGKCFNAQWHTKQAFIDYCVMMGANSRDLIEYQDSGLLKFHVIRRNKAGDIIANNVFYYTEECRTNED